MPRRQRLKRLRSPLSDKWIPVFQRLRSPLTDQQIYMLQRMSKRGLIGRIKCALLIFRILPSIFSELETSRDVCRAASVHWNDLCVYVSNVNSGRSFDEQVKSWRRACGSAVELGVALNHHSDINGAGVY